MCGADLQIGAELCVSGPASGAAPPFVSSSLGFSSSTTINASGTSLGSSATSSTTPSNSSSCAKFHKVVAGDSCSSIAASEGISESSIEQLNPNLCGVNVWLLCPYLKMGTNRTIVTSRGSSLCIRAPIW